jgi:hypothetical protein
MFIQCNPKGKKSRVQYLPRKDRATRRDWLPMGGWKLRCRELIAFKEEVGHCNVPARFANNSGLGHWCSDIRCSYNAIQKGNKAKYNISQERIERLEEIGFQWQVLMDYNSKSFE